MVQLPINIYTASKFYNPVAILTGKMEFFLEVIVDHKNVAHK